MGREPSYTRNRVLLDSLAEAGVEVVPYTDSGGNYPLRFLRVLARFAFRPARDMDAVFVGFFGQPFIPFVRLLTKKPIMLDAFLSSFDTMCYDRRRFKPGSLAGRFFYRLDRSACMKSDVVLLDTERHIEYFARTFGVETGKFRRVFVGADTTVFKPADGLEDPDVFNVFYYCTFHPVHGTEHVVRAAHLLESEKGVKFTIIGTGQERPAIDRLARELRLSNTEFIDWVEYSDLTDAIARSHVCLGGHFANVEKAGRVIAGKSFQFAAMRKPVIVGDNAANRELFTHRKDAYLVPMADPDAIARAIIELRDDPELRKRLAENGYRTFLDNGTPTVIGRQLAAILEELISSSSLQP